MRTVTEQQKIQRRDQILRTAAALFAEKNYHQVLMDEVAERSGIAKGSLYNYFSNKEDLFISIITHRLSSLLSLLQERIDTRQAPLTNLRRIIIHIYSFMAKYPHFFQIWYKEKLNCRKQTHQETQRLYQSIKNLIIVSLEKGIEEGILTRHCPHLVADICLGMIDSAVIRTFNQPVEVRREERIKLFEFILAALGTGDAKKLHAAGADEPSEAEYPLVSEK